MHSKNSVSLEQFIDPLKPKVPCPPYLLFCRQKTPEVFNKIREEKIAQYGELLPQSTEASVEPEEDVSIIGPNESAQAKLLTTVKSADDSLYIQRAGESTARRIPSLVTPRRNEVLSRLGLMWRNMSEEEQKPWKDLYKVEDTEYKARLKEYKESGRAVKWPYMVAKYLIDHGTIKDYIKDPSDTELVSEIIAYLEHIERKQRLTHPGFKVNRSYFSPQEHTPIISLRAVRHHLEHVFGIGFLHRRAFISETVAALTGLNHPEIRRSHSHTFATQFPKAELDKITGSEEKRPESDEAVPQKRRAKPKAKSKAKLDQQLQEKIADDSEVNDLGSDDSIHLSEDYPIGHIRRYGFRRNPYVQRLKQKSQS